MDRDNNDYYIGCIAMAIVNYTNETNKVSVDTRQSSNDKCFSFAETKIRELLGQGYLIGIDIGEGKDTTAVYTPPLFL